MESSFLHNPHGTGNHAHAATLSTDGRTLYAAWYAYPEKEHEDGQLAFATRTLGQDWKKSSVLNFNAVSSYGNPVLHMDESGTLWLFFVLIQGSYWHHAVSYIAKSENEGRTWNASRKTGMEPGVMVRHKPFIRSNGDFLLPAYDEESQKTLLMSSRKPDEPWKLIHEFPSEFIQADPVCLGAKELQLYFRPCGEDRLIHRAFSQDDGATWSNPIPTTLPCPLSGIAAAALGDLILIAHNHTTKHQRTPMSISWSSDRGMSWQGPWHIDESPFEISYPTMTVTGDNTIHLLYTYNRRMIKYLSFTREELEAQQ